MTSNKMLTALRSAALFYAFAVMFALTVVFGAIWLWVVVIENSRACVGEPNLIIRWLEAGSYIFAVALSPWLFKKFFR